MADNEAEWGVEWARRGGRIDWAATRSNIEQKLYQDYADGRISTDVYLRRSEELEGDLQRIRRKLYRRNSAARGRADASARAPDCGPSLCSNCAEVPCAATLEGPCHVQVTIDDLERASG